MKNIYKKILLTCLALGGITFMHAQSVQRNIATGSRTVVPNNPIPLSNPSYYSPQAVIFTDSFDGANDTTSLKARGYLPYYRGTGPQGVSATWYTGIDVAGGGPFDAFNGPTAGYVASNYNTVTATNNIDNWLVLPALNVAIGDTISFYSQSPLSSTFPDSIRVMYSAAGDSVPEDLTWVELGRFKVNILGMWERKTYTAPSAGATGRFAIRYCVTNGGPGGSNSDYIGIDQLDIIQATAVGCPDVIVDGGFEAGSPSAAWIEASTNFGTPLCTVAGCGTGTGTGPHNGSTWWAWFGGIAAFEEGSLTQTVTLASGSTANLSFYLEQIICDDVSDFLDVVVDGTTVFHSDGSSPLCGVLGYSLQTVNLDAYCDGNPHTIVFHSIINGINGAGSNFFVDDVSLLVCPAGPCSAAWAASPATLCATSAPINLDALVTGDPGGTWSGNGVTGNMFDPTGLSGPVAITYTVTVGSCTDSQTHSFNVVATTPVCSFTVSVTLSTATITNTTTGATSYSWDFGDGSPPDNSTNPVHNYSNGTYTITLSATNVCGTVTCTQPVTISTCIENRDFTGLALAIPDADVTTGASDAETVSGVSGTALGTDINLTSVCIDITHTWVGDLAIVLTAPNGTQITLMDQPGVPASTFGCAGDNLSACVVPGTGNEMENVCSNLPAISGSYTAANATDLNAINLAGGSPNGTWTLTVTDAAAGDVGTLDNWSLTFDAGPSAAWSNTPFTPCTTPPINLDLLLTGTSGGTWSGAGVTGNMFDPSGQYGTVPVTYTITVGPCTSTETHSFQVYCEFENYGWVSKPDVTDAAFGLAGAFWLNGSAGSDPGQLFAFGGVDAGFAAIQTYNNSFATIGNSWSAMAGMPTGKFQFSAQRVGDKIYMSGGYNPSFVGVPETYIYDVINDSWSTGAPMPLAVGDYASGVYMDSLIYYIGGYSGADENIVQIYNTFTDSWSTGTIKPGTAASGLRGGINGNKIVTVGGYNQTLAAEIDEAYLGTIDPIDPTQITWTALPPYPAGTTGRLAAGVPYGEQHPLVIFVGGDPDGGGVIVKNDCWGYDINDNQWKYGPDKITAVSNISDFVGIVYNDSLWMGSVAGYDGAVVTTVHEWLNLGSYTPLSVSENIAENGSFNVYPNPAHDYLSVNIKDKNILIKSVKVFDVTGREVLTSSFDKKEMIYSMNVKDLTKGIYFVELNTSDGKQLTAKFSKQ